MRNSVSCSVEPDLSNKTTDPARRSQLNKSPGTFAIVFADKAVAVVAGGRLTYFSMRGRSTATLTDNARADGAKSWTSLN